ncbi:MAG TPA: DUF2950 domain-containing protein [Steroidobacteraceae bacterium]|nr:DUF2950 domain-containing protein [Steroidobacteraceae bacterium]
MTSASANPIRCAILCVVLSGTVAASAATAPEPAATQTKAAAPASAGKAAQNFDTPEQAAEALISAAEKFDVDALIKIVGSDGEDLVLTGEFAQDRERAQEFAAKARKKMKVATLPNTGNRAALLVGEDDWPFALPIVKHGSHWSFDAAAGRDELFNRRIGANELDAIAICRGYVEAQYDYAYRKRSGYEPSQYAQRVIASPGKQDGLAWQKADGTWDGPVGEKVARAIERGYDLQAGPYHGYFFKVLKAQGPNAPLGAMDFVVKGIMIGGFALVAAPAEYGETGFKTFMVGETGIVYQKDLGPATLEAFQKMDRFDPDKSWTPVEDDED